MSNEKNAPSVDGVKLEILRAINRGLNVTANAPHIRDLAAAYSLLDGKSAERNFPRQPTSPVAKL